MRSHLTISLNFIPSISQRILEPYLQTPWISQNKYCGNYNFLSCVVSGLSGSKEIAQSQVSIGMGLLAGSTILLLTIIWGTSVIVGKCDIEEGVAKDSVDTRGFNLTGMSFHAILHSFNVLQTSLVDFFLALKCIFHLPHLYRC